MKEPTLFLICPECQIEHTINRHFTGSFYFLTALGSVFDTSELSYAFSVNEFLKRENVKNIVVVCDSSCKFIQSVLNRESGYQTKAEEVLNVLHTHCNIEIMSEKVLSRRAFKLAELNIMDQLSHLKETPFVNERINFKEVKIRGMIYEREIDKFNEIAITHA